MSDPTSALHGKTDWTEHDVVHLVCAALNKNVRQSIEAERYARELTRYEQRCRVSVLYRDPLEILYDQSINLTFKTFREFYEQWTGENRDVYFDSFHWILNRVILPPVLGHIFAHIYYNVLLPDKYYDTGFWYTPFDYRQREWCLNYYALDIIEREKRKGMIVTSLTNTVIENAFCCWERLSRDRRNWPLSACEIHARLKLNHNQSLVLFREFFSTVNPISHSYGITPYRKTFLDLLNSVPITDLEHKDIFDLIFVTETDVRMFFYDSHDVWGSHFDYKHRKVWFTYLWGKITTLKLPDLAIFPCSSYFDTLEGQELLSQFAVQNSEFLRYLSLIPEAQLREIENKILKHVSQNVYLTISTGIDELTGTYQSEQYLCAKFSVHMEELHLEETSLVRIVSVILEDESKRLASRKQRK